MADRIARYLSPLGEMVMASGDGVRLAGLWFVGQAHFGETLTAACEPCSVAGTPVFEQTARWLDAYFSGTVPGSAPPLELRGTDFRRAVWRELLTVPYGATTTYGALARRLGSSARAVGGAVGRNPVSVILPCHRVLGADGRLTGYAGGTERKARLLALEGAALTK